MSHPHEQAIQQDREIWQGIAIQNCYRRALVIQAERMKRAEANMPEAFRLAKEWWIYRSPPLTPAQMFADPRGRYQRMTKFLERVTFHLVSKSGSVPAPLLSKITQLLKAVNAEPQ